MNYIGLFFLFIFSSCSLFKTGHLDKEVSKDIKKVCLSAVGKGRLMVNGQKYVFSYESALRKNENSWVTAFNFPLYGEEFVQLEWRPDSKKFFHQFSFENKILKQQKGVSPEELETFFQIWAKFIYDVIQMKDGVNKGLSFKWSIEKRSLIATKRLENLDLDATISFKNILAAGYFGRYDIAMRRGDQEPTFKIESIVRKCLEKPE